MTNRPPSRARRPKPSREEQPLVDPITGKEACCPHCDKPAELREGAGTYECGSCGEDFEVEVPCPECGVLLDVGSWDRCECGECGKTFDPTDSACVDGPIKDVVRGRGRTFFGLGAARKELHVIGARGRIFLKIPLEPSEVLAGFSSRHVKIRCRGVTWFVDPNGLVSFGGPKLCSSFAQRKFRGGEPGPKGPITDVDWMGPRLFVWGSNGCLLWTMGMHSRMGIARFTSRELAVWNGRRLLVLDAKGRRKGLVRY